MTEGNFTDYVKITVSSGDGGKGSSYLRREKFVPKGGPDGGDGGKGGDVILCGNKNLWTLINFKFEKHFSAGNGGDGGHSRSTGSNGKDALIEVPLGTIVKDATTGEFICEITEDGERFVVVEGGKGGRGNWHFRSSTNQTPRYAQSGIKGSERELLLELKVLADVGLVGFPNAGKSTLLSSLTSAKPKIADYPFTTMKPNLGIVKYRDFKSFVLADIPGIIEGASQGKGLGHYFLRHIERNSVLLFVIPSNGDDIVGDYKILLRELELYNPELLNKDRVIAISKTDIVDSNKMTEIEKALVPHIGSCPLVFISSVTGFGLSHLCDVLWSCINQ